MKAVIKIAKTEAKKLQTAARITNVKLLQDGSADVGNGMYMVNVDTLDPANLFELGKSFATVTGKELDHVFAAEEQKAKEKAERKKAAK